MPGQNLTRAEAVSRKNVVDVHSYDVALDLTQGEETFRSHTVVTFSATEGESTFIDLISPFVHRIVLNGKELETGLHQDSRIALSDLQDSNTLEVAADCAYMHTGEGMHRFVDPADGQAYVYTQFEVPDSRRVFAVFEQPDLKATFKFKVTVPAGWVVFSNSITPAPQKDQDAWTYDFEPSEKISSYITAIVAGPYKGVTDQLTSSDGRTIPLGVYCRASLEEHLDADRIIDVTKQGFGFYEKMYNRPYPFTKYDQIFVPEYNAGAMENAGCITFRDQYLFRTPPTRAQLGTRANTILHELAHMWFGDLVTMKWWNDLWLNESFAEFMSHQCSAEATEYEDAWTAFGSRKAWGTTQDQLPSTHPIAAEINDLNDIEVNFDGITYAKGAAVLRQLVAYVGRENFEKGLHAYFDEHAWGNTELADLLSKLSEASGRDLDEWAKVWLQEAGITLLRTSVSTDEDGTIRDLSIVQELPMEGTSLRPHRLTVGAYDLQDGKLVRTARWGLDVDGARTPVSEAVGTKRPDVIVLNDEDLGYAKIRLDEDSFKFALDHIGDFEDPLPRSVVMQSLWDQCRDGQISARAYIDASLPSVAAETDSAQRALVASHMIAAATVYSNPATRDQTVADLSRRLHLMAVAQPSGSDAQKQLLLAAAHVAVGAELDWLKALLDGSETMTGIEIKSEVRWTLIRELAAAGAIDEAFIDEELAADDTLSGREEAAASKASLPSNRQGAHERMLSDTSIPNGTLSEMLSAYSSTGWRNPGDTAHIDHYFEQINSVWDSFTFHMAEDIINDLFPDQLVGLPGEDVVAQAEKWLQENEQATPALRRRIIECLDFAKRASKAQAADK